MTKVTFIGNEPTKESKHIELVKYYQSPNHVNEIAEGWKCCDLAVRNVKDGLDLILCYDFNASVGAISYLGHWNDGTTSNPDTVCTVLGEDVAVKKGKGIEFVKLVNSENSRIDIKEPLMFPRDFTEIQVIRYGKDDCLDIFYAYGQSGCTIRENGLLYLGHLNDGFVE
jgi:hypothetical protein